MHHKGRYRIIQEGGGRQHTNLPDFPKNCMKLRKFWSGGGGGRPWIHHCISAHLRLIHTKRHRYIDGQNIGMQPILCPHQKDQRCRPSMVTETFGVNRPQCTGRERLI